MPAPATLTPKGEASPDESVCRNYLSNLLVAVARLDRFLSDKDGTHLGDVGVLAAVKWRRTARLGALPQRIGSERPIYQHFLQHCFQLRANANFPSPDPSSLIAVIQFWLLPVSNTSAVTARAYKSLLGKTCPVATVPLERILSLPTA